MSFNGLNFFEDPVSNPSTFRQPSTPIDWNGIIRQAFGIGSQAINAYSGQNTGTQIGYNSSTGSVFAIQPTANGQPQTAGYPDPTAGMNADQRAAYYQRQNSLGSAAGSGIDGVMTWIGNNPMVVLGLGVGAYLLFKQPPGRR